jgi:hypothetical protein
LTIVSQNKTIDIQREIFVLPDVVRGTSPEQVRSLHNDCEEIVKTPAFTQKNSRRARPGQHSFPGSPERPLQTYYAIGRVSWKIQVKMQ